MSAVGERNVECPACGEQAFCHETWISTFERHEECSQCGFFRELICKFRLEEEFTRCGEKQVLQQMHLHYERGYLVRQGFIKKTEEQKGQYHVIDRWFSSPSDLEGVEIKWLDELQMGKGND